MTRFQLYLFGLIGFAFLCLSACSTQNAFSPTTLAPSKTLAVTLSPAKPTRTVTPPPTATPTQTLQPTIAWSVPATELQMPPEITDWHFESADWVTDNTLTLEDANYQTYNFNPHSGIFENSATPLPPPAGLPKRRTSHSTYYEIECEDEQLRLYQRSPRHLVSQANLPVYDCSIIDWANNESAASIGSTTGDVYLWWTDGTPPYVVGHGMINTPGSWSPDSQKLLIIDLTDNPDEVTFNIVYPNGQPMRVTGAKVEGGNNWFGMGWFTNDVVFNFHGCGDSGNCQSVYLYEALSGKYLIEYHFNPRAGWGQQALLSPDQRWLVIDFNNGHRQALLYDLKTKRSYVWAKDEDDHIVFLKWAKDNSHFFFLYYPRIQNGVFLSTLPIGLLTLNPKGYAVDDIIIPKAIFASFNEASDLTFAVTADNFGVDGAEGLSGAIYTAQGKRLSAFFPFAERLALDSPLAVSFPVAWSHAGDQVVFSNASGAVWLLKSDGTLYPLTSDLPETEKLDQLGLVWSPNDKQLLVYTGQRAWVVSLG